MEYKDYYKILGVEKTATPEEIKKQYRRLARKYHPDVSTEKNAEEQFKQVKEAYEVLKDPQKRQTYDQMGSQWRDGQSFTPPPGWQYQQAGDAANRFGAEDLSGFSDFFAQLFGQRGHGGARQPRYQQRGQDQHAKITLTLEEAFSGIERMIQLQQPQIDPRSGQMRMETRSLKVKIPAGAIQGQQIRLPQQGSPGVGGGPGGDLYLEIQLAHHHLYHVKQRDIYLNLPLTPWEAALGAKITVPTLAGNVGMTIPAGSQTGKQLRLKGRGLPGSPAGDQYVTLTIYTPPANNDAERQLYEQMAQVMPFNPRSEFTQ